MKKTVIILLLGALAFYSCQNPVGLGRMVNLDTPEVVIGTPLSMAHVGQRSDGNTFLDIAGTAEDKIHPIEEVLSVSVIVERVSTSAAGSQWRQEWKGERGGWQRVSSTDNTEWKKEDGTWEEFSNGALIKWSLTILMNDSADGEYLISVNAQNNIGLEGAVTQRRVIVDKVGPITHILAPFLEDQDDTPESLGYRLRNPALMDKLHNESITVQYEIDDEFSIKKLKLELFDDQGVSRYVYNKDNAVRSSSILINGAEINMTDEDGFERENIQLTVVTTAWDEAENEKMSSHGWLMWWPNSDRPWITGVGQEDPNLAKRSEIYPGSDVQVLAYDDDGVNYVEMRIYKKGSSIPIPGYDVADHLEPVRQTNPPIGGKHSTFFTFSFKAPEDCDEYEIRADVYDYNAGRQPAAVVKGDPTFVRYFYIMDVHAPSVKVNGPPQTTPLFLSSDNNGTFTINGEAGDGVQPVSLKLVWLNPNADMESQFLYQSADYDGWNITNGTANVTNSNGEKYWKDSEGNLIWVVEMGPPREPNPPVSPRRIIRDFAKNINLFDDLNIGGGAVPPINLTAQTFVLRVEGSTGGRAVTVLHSVSGDTSLPSISIETIKVERQDIELRTYTTAELNSTLMDALEVRDKLYFKGTWTEDSFDKWQDLSRMNLTVFWNGRELPAHLNIDKTWEAGPLDIEDSTTSGGLIDAQLVDLGDNMGKATFNVRVNTSFPYLMFISATNPDGAYKAGEVISIYMEFSKDVEYQGGSYTPYLELDNGGRAEYKGSGAPASAKHYFEYTVAANGEETSDLNVDEIKFDGMWYGSAEATISLRNGDRGNNLANNKDIVIDTTAPQISGVEALTINGHYNEGRIIYLDVRFSESIQYTQGTGTRLILNVNGTGGTGAGLSPSIMGEDALLFEYIVRQNDNTPTTPTSDFLTAIEFILGTGKITDAAGNELTVATIPAGHNIKDNGRDIVIDTLAPAAPVVNVPGGFGTFPSKTFTISSVEPSATIATIEYSVLRNDSRWRLYTGEVTLSSKGDYYIRARQTDHAGNVSPEFGPTDLIRIETSSPLLESFGGSDPGTYRAGEQISIYLNLREPVSVSGLMSLTLNIPQGSPRNVLLTSPTPGNFSDTLEFKFTVLTGDDIDVLLFTSINMAGVTLTSETTGLDVTGELLLNKPTLGLNDYTRIGISTISPVLQSLIYNPAAKELVLTFSKDVYKGTGNIEIVQEGNYIIPAVLTRTEYQRFGGSALSPYYVVGTNGTDAAGNADTSEKYILKYDIDTASTTDAATIAARDILIANNANKIIVPVVSSRVTIDPDNRKRMTVNMGDDSGYALRVKGVNYNVTYPANLVQDSLSHPVIAHTEIISNPGVNPPFIRVQKGSASISNERQVAVPLWIKDADVSFTEQIGANWVFIEPFIVTLPNNTDLAISITPVSNYIRGGRYDGGPTDRGQLQGALMFNSTTGVFRRNGWGGEGLATGFEKYHDSRANESNNFLAGGDWYVNPYVYPITYGTPNWGTDGIFVIRDGLWVNTSTGSKQVQATSPGVGWLRGPTDSFTTEPGIAAVQPYTAEVKIDCQTPGATIQYTRTTDAAAQSAPFGSDFRGALRAAPSVSMPTSSTTAYNGSGGTGPFTLGGNTMNGYLYGIRAQAQATNDGATHMEPAYEKAARSVIRFNGFSASNLNNNDTGNTFTSLINEAGSTKTIQLWLRGGDGLSGDNLTPGFPLSWNERDYNPGPTSIQLLSQISGTDDWYWITWEINARPAYFHFIAGTTWNDPTSNNLTDIKNNGPINWGWSKNAWSFSQSQYPLRPGESLRFVRDTQVDNAPQGRYEFFGFFSGNR